MKQHYPQAINSFLVCIFQLLLQHLFCLRTSPKECIYNSSQPQPPSDFFDVQKRHVTRQSTEPSSIIFMYSRQSALMISFISLSSIYFPCRGGRIWCSYIPLKRPPKTGGTEHAVNGCADLDLHDSSETAGAFGWKDMVGDSGIASHWFLEWQVVVDLGVGHINRSC